MDKAEVSADLLNGIWKFFASVRLTVVLLLTLAATSIIGTVIPQNQDPSAYYQAFGDFLFRLFSILDFFDMYHSWWFQLLLFLLTVNVIVCSVDRLSATWKIVFARKPKFNLNRFRNMKNRVEFSVARPSEKVAPAAEALVSRKFNYHVEQASESGIVFFAEKWRWTRLGVYIVHSSIVLLLIGGIIGSMFGFEGYVNIAEGESTGTIRLRNSGEAVQLGFEIRCDDFDVSFYDSGMPKEFRSSLTIIEGGNTVLSRDILVNHPLRFKGINIFQSSYGELPPAQQPMLSDAEITLNFASKETGMVYTRKGRIGQTLEIPENLGSLQLKEFKPNYDFRGTELGATLIASLTQKDGTQVDVILPVKFPSFDRMSQMFDSRRSDAVMISLAGSQAEMPGAQAKRYYTGLQVTKDPGVALVYIGFVMMLAGCVVTFFMSHQQVCVELTPARNKTRIAVSGTANRGKFGMERKVDGIGKKLVSMAETSTEEDQ